MVPSTLIRTSGYLSSLLLAVLVAPASGECVFTQTCYSGAGCTPIPAVGDATIPKPFSNEGIIFPSPFQCPQFTNSSCCTGQQNNALAFNFVEIQTGFSTLGGNNACVKNLQELWCAFTCSPDQDKFVSVEGFVEMIDPQDGNTYKVLLTTILIDSYYACGVWESCKNTFTSELASFSTCEQFMNYQVQSAIPSGSFSIFNYSTASGAGNASIAVPTAAARGKVPLDILLPGTGSRSLDQAARIRAARSAGVPYTVEKPSMLSGRAGAESRRMYARQQKQQQQAAVDASGDVTPVVSSVSTGAATRSVSPLGNGTTPTYYLWQPLYDCCSFPADMTNPQAGNTSAPCAFCEGMCGNPDALCYTMPDMSPGQPGASGNSSGGGSSASPTEIDRVTLPVLYGCAWQAIVGMYAAIVALIAVREAFSFFVVTPVGTGADGSPTNRCGFRIPCSRAAGSADGASNAPNRKRSIYEADAALRERLVPSSGVGALAGMGLGLGAGNLNAGGDGCAAAGSINGPGGGMQAAGGDGEARGVVFSMPAMVRKPSQ